MTQETSLIPERGGEQLQALEQPGAPSAGRQIAEMLPSPPVTRNQVELMQIDNVSSPEMPGFGELGITPHPVEEIVQEIL